jgi:hypothetical protein
MSDAQRLSLGELVAILHGDNPILPAAAFYRLSALPRDDLAALEEAWPGLPVERRRALLADLNVVGEANFEMDFRAVARMALDDDDGEVRRRAIACLWEDHTPSLMRRLMDMLTHDPAAETREAAASALGRFVLMGELEELPEGTTAPLEDLLLAICREPAEPLDVRRRALEALGYSGRKETVELIEDAYDHDALRMRVSAVFAMGRSADERWADHVLRELESYEPEMRYEAAHAAGELGLADAVPGLIELLASDDVELVFATVWSLGEIGGPEARHALTDLSMLADDEDLLDAIDDALAMASLMEGALGLFDLPEVDSLDGGED